MQELDSRKTKNLKEPTAHRYTLLIKSKWGGLKDFIHSYNIVNRDKKNFLLKKDSNQTDSLREKLSNDFDMTSKNKGLSLIKNDDSYHTGENYDPTYFIGVGFFVA